MLPLFGWILQSFARLLSFSFTYSSGVLLLKAGYESRKTAVRVKGLLTVLVVSSVFEVLPVFLFNATNHLGPLWTFGLPVILYTTPTPGDATVAEMMCDSFGGQAAGCIAAIMPGSFKVHSHLSRADDATGPAIRVSLTDRADSKEHQ